MFVLCAKRTNERRKKGNENKDKNDEKHGLSRLF